MKEIVSFQTRGKGVTQFLSEYDHPYPRVCIMTQGIDFYGVRLEFNHYQTDQLRDDHYLAGLEEKYKHFFGLGDNLLSLGKAKEARDYYLQALEIAVHVGHKEAESRLFSHIASTYKVEDKDELSKECYQQALDIAKEGGFLQEEADCLVEIASLLPPNEAIGYHLKALGIYEKIGDRSRKQASLVNIGIVYFELADYDKAIKFCWNALQIHSPELEIDKDMFAKEKETEINSRIIAYFNMGRAWEVKGKKPLAIDSYQQAFEQCEKLRPYIKTTPQKKKQLMKIEYMISGRIMDITQKSPVKAN